MNMFFLFVSLLFLDFKRKRAESRAQINTLKLKHNADAQISRIASCRMNNGKTTSLGI